MPRRNHTPPHTPYVDRRPDCSHKQTYRDKDTAERAAHLRMLEQPHLTLGVYQCERCRLWHLTSIEPGQHS